MCKIYKCKEKVDFIIFNLENFKFFESFFKDFDNTQIETFLKLQVLKLARIIIVK